MPTPQHRLINIVADHATTRHHHESARETKHMRAFSRDVLRITKYRSPKKPSAIPSGSTAQSPAEGLAPSIVDDVQTSERSP